MKLLIACGVFVMVFASGFAILYSPSIMTTERVITDFGNATIEPKEQMLDDPSITVIGYGRNICLNENCTRIANYVVNWCKELKEGVKYCEINAKKYICQSDGECTEISLQPVSLR